MNSEQVFDMLPHAGEIMDKLDIKNFAMQAVKADKNIDQKEVGVTIIQHIMKNSAKIKDEVFAIVAIAQGKTVEEVKAQSISQTITAFKEIFSDKELLSFFKTAMQ